MRFGLLLPHFGAYASRSDLISAGRRAEELGFDSVWARDHLVWEPHGMEGTNKSFIDPFLALTAVAATTSRLTVGTGVVIPIRWPLKLAQEFMGLSMLNEGRVVAGIGLGHNPAEFAAAGFDANEKREILFETVQICRQAWDNGVVTHKGDVFTIDGVELAPKPQDHIPLVYGGNTPRSVRYAADLSEGWYPGRLPLRTLRHRLAYLNEYAGERAKDVAVLVQPLVVVAETREEAEALVPIKEVSESSGGARFWLPPESGSYDSVSDLEGLVVCGTPDDVIEQVQAIIELGIDEFIFDFRLQFHEFSEVLEVVGAQVLPHL